MDQHGALPFPQSLPQFQRLFPDDAACAEQLKKVLCGATIRMSNLIQIDAPQCSGRAQNTWLTGTHHGVSAQRLQAYLKEFTFRFNRRFYPFNASARCSTSQAIRRRRPYAEFYCGDWAHPTFSGCVG
jgi:hypothetical protein